MTEGRFFVVLVLMCLNLISAVGLGVRWTVLHETHLWPATVFATATAMYLCAHLIYDRGRP